MEQQYLNLLQEVLDTGVKQSNRTGIDCYTIPGAMLKFDLSQGFPALTTKKLAWKQVVGELIGFLRGYTSAADFRKVGCTIWDQNANENKAWLNNIARQGEDDLGHIYGAMWREWPVTDPVGYQSLGLDQIANALHDVRRNPESRRIIVNAWNPEFLNQAALPPCHVLFQLIPHTATGKLHMCMYQRSCDMFLGVPFNIASYALLLELFASWTGYTAGTLTMMLADVHIYENHVEQVKTQLDRIPYKAPRLWLEYMAPPSHIQKLDIDVLVASMDPDRIHLMEYEYWPAIKAPMAV